MKIYFWKRDQQNINSFRKHQSFKYSKLCNITHFNIITKNLEALAVDDGGAALVVLLLGDPHLLEGGEGGQDGSSDPD